MQSQKFVVNKSPDCCYDASGMAALGMEAEIVLAAQRSEAVKHCNVQPGHRQRPNANKKTGQ
ncbi:hypothetical protein [Flavobacterium noncentrifugens]|uniref:hypothetical protein n=1 Tax=Flavobacterium noncentrifugens TaxID=1128970 RepID=UPI001113EE36|nr:hypothetical protein [Flavobacterium noncentrifugens]